MSETVELVTWTSLQAFLPKDWVLEWNLMFSRVSGDIQEQLEDKVLVPGGFLVKKIQDKWDR